MLFLIEYDPKKRERKSLKTFDDSEEEQARKERLALELDLHRKKIDNEVVLLKAKSEAVLQHTHQRYFDPDGILDSFRKALGFKKVA